jgi:TRAP-type C4-dicarboxylate transport system substrate-binding protein
MSDEKKCWREMTQGAVLLALALLAGAMPAAAQAKVKLATLVPRGTSYHQILQAMGEQWRQAPGGGVKLTLYTDGTMGSEADMVRRMRVGQLQAATLTVAGLAEIEPSVSALQKMPMMFRSLEEVDYVRGKLEERLSQRLLDKGFVVLFWGDTGWVRFFSKRPARVPNDFRGMKIFVSAGDNQQVDLMKDAGFNPVPLEWTDALTALKTGMIDAVPVIPYYSLAGQFYTEAKYMVEVNWAPLVGATIVTRQAWEALPPETREALRKAAALAGEQFRARGRAESNEAVEAMKKRGLVVQAMSPEMEAEWRKMAEGLYPRIRGRLVPAEWFDEVRRLLNEYRSAQASK